MSATREILRLVDELEGSASDEQVNQKYRELYEIARANLAAFRRHRATVEPDNGRSPN